MTFKIRTSTIVSGRSVNANTMNLPVGHQPLGRPRVEPGKMKVLRVLWILVQHSGGISEVTSAVGIELGMVRVHEDHCAVRDPAMTGLPLFQVSHVQAIVGVVPDEGRGKFVNPDLKQSLV